MRKLLLVIALVGVMGVARLSAQMSVSIQAADQPITEIIDKIEQTTNYVFVFDEAVREQLQQQASIDVTGRTIGDVMDRLLQGTGLGYKVSQRQVMIFQQTVPPQQQGNGRTVTVVGKVTDKDGEPLPGASVVLKGQTQVNAITSAVGNYEIEVPREGSVLVVSFVGMVPREVRVGKSRVLNVVLNDDVAQLKGVEVVGNGMFQRRSETFTGSAATFTGEQIRMSGSVNALQSLKNLDPSFIINENVDMGSNPNTMPDVQFRGQSSIDLKGDYETSPNLPLFILNGFETSLEKIVDMDMNLIQTITILKDAAAKAIYGSKAANGVVVVETVQPKQGRLRVSYNGSLELTVPDLNSYNLTDAAGKLQAELLAGKYTNESNAHTQAQLTEQYNELYKEVARGVDSYWMSQPLRTGVGQRHSLMLDGGDQAMLYSASLSYNGIAGVMKGSDRRTVSGNITLSYRLKSLIFRNQLTFDDNTGSYTVSARMYFRTYSTGGDRARYIDSDSNDFDPSSATSLTSSSGSYNQTATENNIIKLVKATAGSNAALSISPNSLSGFSSVGGVSPSEAQSVAVVGANLQSNVNVTLPAGFEACTTATGTYASTLTLTPTNGELRAMVYVRLSANANPGSVTGNMTFTCGSTTITVSLSGNVVASGATQYTITANASPAAGGTVSGAGTYYEGLTCTLTATANAGYEFQNWSDGNTENPRSFTVTGNASYTAVFAEIPVYEITVSEVSNGSISADKSTAMSGETVTLTASPNSGYAFESWHVYETENVSNTVTVTDNSFTMPDFDVTVAATFAPMPQYVKVTSAPSDWSGEYILVYEQSTTTGYIWTGIDNASCYVSKPISNGTIADDDFVTIIIAPMNNGYSVKVNGGTNDGKYIYGSSNSNKINFGTSAVLNTFSYESNSVKMVSNTAIMRFNSTSNNLRFRYFKSSSASSYQAIQLYKKVIPDGVTYTITFNANGGSGSMNPQVVNELEVTALTANTFTREGYDFVGWNTAPESIMPMKPLWHSPTTSPCMPNGQSQFRFTTTWSPLPTSWWRARPT